VDPAGENSRPAPQPAPQHPAAPSVQRPPTPAELAASLSFSADGDLDRAVEEAMRGVTSADAAGEAAEAPRSTDLHVDDMVTGRIANIGSRDVLIDFDGKSFGAMPLDDFEKEEKYAVGDSITVMVVGRDERAGLLTVSRKKARRETTLQNLKVGTILDGRVTGMNKGGLEVDVEGLRAFIPASQVELHFMKDISDLIGQSIRAEVTRFEKDGDRENIVLSRRKVLVREEEEKKESAYAALEVGQTRRGVVRNVTEYGAFVDIGGMDGLLHVTDMSWGRVNKPEDVVKIGDEIEVKVIKVNREKKKVSLSLKQTKPDPWSNAAERYSKGLKLSGRVVRLESFGAFVELEPGLDGLVPLSEMSWTKRIRHASDVLKEGDVVEVSVLDLDPAKRRMSLSLKALVEDPWATAAARYHEGEKIKGKVVRTTDFGAFVQLEDGVDGLIHISEISDERIRAVADKVKPGDEVEVRVLNVDAQAKKIALSMRQPPTGPTPEELAKMQAERTVEAKKKAGKPRRGGITVGWNDGDLSLGQLDPSKFGR
jgi:small subunit ribosomal protein S1